MCVVSTSHIGVSVIINDQSWFISQSLIIIAANYLSAVSVIINHFSDTALSRTILVTH